MQNEQGGPHFYGAVTVGERGQIVIPAEARHELGFAAGDKLLIVKHPSYPGLMMFKLESAKQFLEATESVPSHAVEPLTEDKL